MCKINEVLSKPTLANMVEGGRTPMLPNEKLFEIGYSIVIYPTASVFMTAHSMLRLMNHLKESGSTVGMMDQMLSFGEFNDLIGLDATIEELQKIIAS